MIAINFPDYQRKKEQNTYLKKKGRFPMGALKTLLSSMLVLGIGVTGSLLMKSELGNSSIGDTNYSTENFSVFSGDFISLPSDDTTTPTETPEDPVNSADKNPLSPEEEPTPDLPPEEPALDPYEFRIVGVGDNLIHEGINYQAAAATGYSSYDYQYSYLPMIDYIAGADLASINQETVLSWRSTPSGYPRFNSSPKMADSLAGTGFDIINLANNHMYDMGEIGLQDTLELLKWDYGFTVTGAYLSEEDYLTIPVHTIGDVDIAFIATTQSTNGLSIPSSSPLVGSVTNTETEILEFLSQVERATAISDIVIANIHWGSEYTFVPSAFQEDLAHRAIEAGVDVIFGHHPHVIQPVEYITRSDGSTGVVCYSLGNFISLQDYTARMIGGMLDVTFAVNGTDITIQKVEFIPCITHFERPYVNIQTFPYWDYSETLASRHMVTMSMWRIYDTVTSVVRQEFLPQDFYDWF